MCSCECVIMCTGQRLSMGDFFNPNHTPSYFEAGSPTGPGADRLVNELCGWDPPVSSLLVLSIQMYLSSRLSRVF